MSTKELNEKLQEIASKYNCSVISYSAEGNYEGTIVTIEVHDRKNVRSTYEYHIMVNSFENLFENFEYALPKEKEK